MILESETDLAKGRKKGNREVRKPKMDKPKPIVAAATFLTTLVKSK